ncbi:VanZ family protein [Aliihoeflea sp. 2WW]|uniref:VanZ family protein n=1 Tax=Aliihoeflea sp. 2WW TaxID=1381123 RepID=UPI0004B0AF7B|nr:VanZ family protein [Aliihoeflea sp. 2WW]
MAPGERSRPQFSAPTISVGLVVATLLVLSLVPVFGDLRTGIPGEIEHFGAYLVSSIIMAAAVPGRRFAIAAGLIALALASEALQAFIPGRSAAFGDAVAGFVGSACGLSIDQYARRWRKKRAQAALSKGHLS